MGDWIVFEKYSLLGNTFLIVDESRCPFQDDAERAHFARWALDGNFGIGGADNVIYLARDRFRIFEWDGSETLSCGNGLLCTAHWLGRSGAGTEWRIWTELPTAHPRTVRVGVAGDGWTWVDAGRARTTPAELYRRSGPVPPDGIDVVPDIEVDGPAGKLTLAGRLVFTGEPHLVIPVGPDLDDYLFHPHYGGGEIMERIGAGINAGYRSRFPAGVHVSVVQVVRPDGTLRYRTWERAINRETLACGTGALACAYVCRALGLTTGDRITLWPHRARRYEPDAALHVTHTAGGMALAGRPTHVCTGCVPGGIATGRNPVSARIPEPERQNSHV